MYYIQPAGSGFRTCATLRCPPRKGCFPPPQVQLPASAAVILGVCTQAKHGDPLPDPIPQGIVQSFRSVSICLARPLPPVMTFRGTRQPRTHASSRTVLLGLLIGFAIALFKLSSTVTSSISSTNSFPATQRHQSDVGGWRQKPALPAGLPMEVYARGPSQDRDAIARVAALLSDDEKKQLRELCGRTLYHSLQTGWVSHETGAWTFVATGEVGGLVFEGQACANGFGPCLCHVQADLQPLAMSIWCPRMFVTYVVATRHVVLGRGGRHGDESRHMPLVMPLMARHGQPTALSVSLLAAGDLPLMWIRDSAVQIDVLLPRIAKRPALRRVIEGAIRAQAFFITQVGPERVDADRSRCKHILRRSCAYVACHPHNQMAKLACS